jgi:hypothetical protein
MSDHHPAATAKPARCCPVPVWPRRLGAAGALLFVALGLLSWIEGPWQSEVRFALIAYGAVILSFVGALHWAFAMLAADMTEAERKRGYAWSVLPAVLGWIALLLPPSLSVALLLLGLWSHYSQDVRLTHRVALADWYLPLRLGLTSAASVGLIIGWLAL